MVNSVFYGFMVMGDSPGDFPMGFGEYGASTIELPNPHVIVKPDR